VIPADAGQPSCARIWNYWLGGTDWEPADQAKASQIERLGIPAPRMALNNRLFASRAVAWAAQSVVQFADLGCGLPPGGKAHEWARSLRPGARCAYIDHDPEVTDTLAAVLDGVAGVTVGWGDIRCPASVFGNGAVLEAADLKRPVCLLFALSLCFRPAGEAADLMAEYVSKIARGSFVAISTLRVDDPRLWERLEAAYTPRLSNFTHPEFAALFAGLDLVPPGAAPAAKLRPGWREAPGGGKDLGTAYVLAGIGVKR
jgi:hypothetical protein